MKFVQHILDDAQRRLALLNRDASVFDAAGIVANPNTPIAVVCDSDGIAIGVVSRTDIARIFSRARGDACNANAESIMTKSVVSCHVDQTLQSVWEAMSARALRCAPVLDDSGRPQGVVHARDLARALLDEVTSEEGLLRNYVLGIGYQ